LAGFGTGGTSILGFYSSFKPQHSISDTGSGQLPLLLFASLSGDHEYRSFERKNPQ